jgi:hypothetical protein
MMNFQKFALERTKLVLMSDFRTETAVSKWPPIDLKFWIGFIWDVTSRNLKKFFEIMDFFGIVAHAYPG